MNGADARLVGAQALIDAHRYTDAVGLLKSHLERNPDDSDADYLLGLAAFGSEDDDLAVTAFERSVRADPDNELAQFGLITTLRQQQRSEPAPRRAEPGPVPDKRARLIAITVGLVLALTVAGVVLFLLPGQKRFDPIQVGDRPEGVAVARGVVWVASRDGAVTRIEPDEPSTKRIELGIGKNLDSVAIGAGSVWVTDEDQGKVARLDESSGSIGKPITVHGRPKGLAVGGRSLWVADCRGAVRRIRLEPDSRPRRIAVTGHPRSVAIARGRVYVAVRPAYTGCGSATPGSGKIAVLDVSGGNKFQRLTGIDDPIDIAFTKDWLWVAEASHDRVLRVEPDTGEMKGEPLRVNRSLTAVAADEDGVWALSRKPRNQRTDEGTVTRIDPATGKRVGNPITIDGDPYEIAIEKGRVWVTQAKTDKVTPIKP